DDEPLGRILPSGSSRHHSRSLTAAADGPGADQAACASSFAASSAAIWTVFSAAPLRRLSLATKRTSPLPAGADWSARMRPTKLALAPAALSGVGTSSRTTPGA